MLEKIKTVIENHTGKTFDITEDTVLLSDLGMDSFDLVSLVCDIEDEFGVEIPDTEFKNLKTVGDVIAFLSKK